MTLKEVKELLSFIEDEDELMEIAKWHSQNAIDYVQNLLYNLH